MRMWCGFPPKISQAEFDDYVATYSTLPFLHEEKPKSTFLAAWKGERQKFEARKKVKHETF